MKDVKAEAGRQTVTDAFLHLLNTTLEATAVTGVFFPRAAPLLVTAGVELLHLLYERHLHRNTQTTTAQNSHTIQKKIKRCFIKTF